MNNKCYKYSNQIKVIKIMLAKFYQMIKTIYMN